MRKILISVVLVLIILTLVGCGQTAKETTNKNNNNSSGTNIINLSDTRLNGNFMHGLTGEDKKFWEYEFNGTNKAVYSANTYYYIWDIKSYDMEIQIDNGKFRERLWNNSYSDWSEWKDYFFDGNGNLTIGTIKYYKQ